MQRACIDNVSKNFFNNAFEIGSLIPLSIKLEVYLGCYNFFVFITALPFSLDISYLGIIFAIILGIPSAIIRKFCRNFSWKILFTFLRKFHGNFFSNSCGSCLTMLLGIVINNLLGHLFGNCFGNEFLPFFSGFSMQFIQGYFFGGMPPTISLEIDWTTFPLISLKIQLVFEKCFWQIKFGNYFVHFICDFFRICLSIIFDNFSKMFLKLHSIIA